ncbi:MAG: hypothetical protein JWL73_2889, partial [Actinomycetia bacterium]|nr:hypothetical protein [Actinomycetes bacterium]
LLAEDTEADENAETHETIAADNSIQ